MRQHHFLAGALVQDRRFSQDLYVIILIADTLDVEAEEFEFGFRLLIPRARTHLKLSFLVKQQKQCLGGVGSVFFDIAFQLDTVGLAHDLC